jgi:type III restriction enzyme
MSRDYEVPEPIICSPFDEPAEHWHIEEGAEPRLERGRRPSVYFRPAENADGAGAGTAIPLRLVELVRGRLKGWRGD